MKKKRYQFFRVIACTAAGGSILDPAVLAETNCFRDVEKLRSKFPGTIAIVYHQTQQEVENAQSFRND